MPANQPILVCDKQPHGVDMHLPVALEKITTDDFDRFDRIIVMDDANYERVHRMAPSTEAANKIYRMVEFCRHHHVTYVPDPYYEGHEGFELVLDLLEDACEGLLEDLTEPTAEQAK